MQACSSVHLAISLPDFICGPLIVYFISPHRLTIRTCFDSRHQESAVDIDLEAKGFP